MATRRRGSARAGLRRGRESAPSSTEVAAQRGFPIVGIGASAGGLEAFTQLVRSLPIDTGMAFVLVQHLDPKHESILPTLMAKVTDMPVRQVEDGMVVQPNEVLVMPPNTDMTITSGVLHLTPRSEVRGQHMPIDNFLHSLARDQQGRAVGVILSGTASDGALGIASIKSEGGITFAQDERSAKYPGMPRAAMASGCIDFILSPENIARELARIANHPYLLRPESPETIPERDEALSMVVHLLRSRHGVDFAYYKPSTIHRRISRRMVLHRIESVAAYATHLQNNPAEVDALFNDILITVTSFFRDPETFEILRTKTFPAIIRSQGPRTPIRVWVPGCATGEEAYSIAICLLEALADAGAEATPQVFATDVSDQAIEKARSGFYPESISQDVSPERLRRFFVRADGGYQVNKTVRDMCIFARQNVAKDPPFSRLDLISCRNVLIYLGPVLQKRIMGIFHYALKPDRFLLLGSSETMSTFADLFHITDRKHKIYVKRATPGRLHIEGGLGDYRAEQTGDKSPKPAEEPWRGLDMLKEADRLALLRWSPPGVLINEQLEILQFRGRTSAFLEPAPGEASLNILKMAREGLLFELRTAVHKAKKDDRTVRKEGLQVKHNGSVQEINLEVTPFRGHSAKERYFLVSFERAAPLPAEQAKRRSAVSAGEQREIEKLRRELAATREHLQAIIEEQEATNEELHSANEEILSSNEELQSTNEELETAKEELQSSNEELTTVNEELQSRNAELSTLNNDLTNLLVSVRIPVVMMGSDLRIRRFTPAAERLLNLIPTDVGRPISDIKTNLDLLNLDQLLMEVIDSVSIREVEVRDRDGRWYSLTVRPYRTSDNKIDGVVMVLLDIDVLKRSQASAKAT